jgi:putative PIN family toxin of toxin-antitoxin system
MIVVCDANVLASGFVGFNLAQSTPGEILRRWRAGNFILVCSQELRIELDRTLQKPYFQQRRTPAQREAVLALLDRHATWMELSTIVKGAAPDPDDDHVLSAAVSSGANVLITGDRALQALGSFQGIRIVSPRDFLLILDEQRRL